MRCYAPPGFRLDDFNGERKVYLMRLPGHWYKIGSATNPEKRFAAVRSQWFRETSWAANLELLGYFAGDFQRESALYRALVKFRRWPSRREYFLECQAVRLAFLAASRVVCISDYERRIGPFASEDPLLALLTLLQSA